MNTKQDKKLFWAPGVVWKINNLNKLEIQNYIFDANYASLFPDFYYFTIDGITSADLMQKFDFENIGQFVEKLQVLNILISSIQDVDEMFFSQTKLFSENHIHNEAIKYDSSVLVDFVSRQLRRQYFSDDNAIKLDDYSPNTLINRTSIRAFSVDKLVSFDAFSSLFSSLSQRDTKTKIQYYYPSAGGLYPIDIYIYVKDGRVEKIHEGLYYYSPIKHQIHLINETRIKKEAHYFLNKAIFSTSAFSIFYIYKATVSMPKYDGMGYYYAILDAGIIMGLLTNLAELLGLGSCIIGAMDFRSIQSKFLLSDDQIFLCDHEFGIKAH